MDVSESTLRRWINSFNEKGLDGLVSRPRSGRPRAMKREDFQTRVAPLIESPIEHGFNFMTAVRLHGYLNSELKCEFSYSSLVRYIHEAGFSLKVPGKIHPDRDEDERAKFVEEMKEILKSPDKIEVWFSDECGVNGDPRTGKAWYRKGTKPKVPYDGCHLRQSIVGAVEPTSGAFEALAVPYTDTTVFQIFLDSLAERTKTSNKQILLVIDNASWHHASSLNWHHIKAKFLPAYSPDLNPIERIWLELKNKFFTNWFTRDPNKLMERVCEGLKFIMDDPVSVSSICTLPY
jgi:transposase